VAWFKKKIILFLGVTVIVESARREVNVSGSVSSVFGVKILVFAREGDVVRGGGILILCGGVIDHCLFNRGLAGGARLPDSGP
jgi:hypothetical protein